MEPGTSLLQTESSSNGSSAPAGSSVRLRPRGTMRRVMIAMFCVFVLSVIRLVLASGSPGTWYDYVVGWLVLLTPIMTCIAPFIGAMNLPAGKKMWVDGENLVVEWFGGKRRIPCSRIKEGWVSPGDGQVHFVTNRDDEYTTVVGEAHSGQALIEQAGVDASKRTLRMRLGPVDFLNAMLVLVGTGVAFTLATKIAELLVLGAMFVIPLFAGLFVLQWYLMHKLIGPAHLVVGADGIIVEQGFRSRFVSFDKVQRVITTSDDVTLHLVDGSEFRARARNMSDVAQATVTERINEALAVRAKRSATTNALAALDRGKRDGLAWRNAMSGLLDKGTGYRAAPVTKEQIIGVLADPAAAADRRLSAAIALVRSGDDEAPNRIRIAAGASANQKVRIALEAIASGDIDNGAIDAAADEEEARRSMSA